MVSAADPRAVSAGIDILRNGGNAMDAAVSVQAMLGLVEPQSSGLGGGAFLLYWDAKREKLFAYDGRETAPASATPDMFLDVHGLPPANYLAAAVGGRSVGVPGVVAMLARAQKAHGVLPWADLFDGAATLAENGFSFDVRTRRFISTVADLDVDETARNYLFENTAQNSVTRARLTNPAYAHTLRRLSKEGPRAFYQGDVARQIVQAVNETSRHPGKMTMEDLSGYQAKERAPLCRDYRSYKVCSMGPPSSGGVALLQILAVLERFDMAALAPGSVQAVHLISEASRLAYADRDLYAADGDIVAVPVDQLLERDYLDLRARLISPDKALKLANPGVPAKLEGQKRAADESRPLPSTSHFTIMDAGGNIVSMTSSIEGPFGSHLMAAGFFLNNELTDFSLVPEKDGVPVANAPAAFKRPRSAMTPVIIFDATGRPFAALGSPGGSRIIAYVAQSVIALIDWKMTMQDAISLPRHANRNGMTEIESETALEDIVPQLQALGHEVKAVPLTSGLHGIRVLQNIYDGGADPRREGIVLSR